MFIKLIERERSEATAPSCALGTNPCGFAALLFSCFCAGCALLGVNGSFSGEAVKDISSESIVNSRSNGSWNCLSVKFRGADFEFIKDFGPNDRIAITSDGRSLRLNDSLRKAESSEIGLAKGAYIMDVFFLSSESGWVTAFNSASETNRQSTSTDFSTHDGGHHWTKQLEARDVEFDSLSFWDQMHGWLVGRTASSGTPAVVYPVVFYTSDGGATWHDLAQAVRTDRTIGYDHVIPISVTEAYLVTSAKQLYQVSSLGAGTKKLTTLAVPEQTHINQVGRLDSGSLWLAGGADSREGTWSVLAVYNGQIWQKFSISNTYIQAAMFLNDNDVIVAGYKVSDGSDKSQVDREKNTLLISSSAGKEFEPVCTDLEIPRIRSITQTPDESVIVAGKDHLITLYRIQK